VPEDFGIERIDRAAIAGGDAEHNARVLKGILFGEKHPAREAMFLNAAAALHLATGDGLVACAERIRQAIDRGTARTTLENWKRAAVRARDS
jgi:anthranilate phosphoribosyltransferase